MPAEPHLGEFQSWRSYWDFARSVRRELRYVRTPEMEAFLEAVLRTSESRRTFIPAGSSFWRAQLGHGWRPMGSDCDEEIPCAYGPERMKPLDGRAWDGRANPRGIPCLYLATTKETAMAEVRPWIGSYISVGQFKTRSALTIVDCSRRHNETPIFFEEPASDDRTNAVWAHIDRAFSEPMTRSDDQADYAPTQIIAELFKQSGLDGVAYKSSFGENGFNIALFDPLAADLTCCGLFEVKSIKPTFDEADQFYFVTPPSTD